MAAIDTAYHYYLNTYANQSASDTIHIRRVNYAISVTKLLKLTKMLLCTRLNVHRMYRNLQ